MAAAAGCQRNIQALARRRPDTHGKDVAALGGGWNLHVEGACAELAVAKLEGCYWEPVWRQIDRDRDDLSGWQVRSTSRPNGSLLLHAEDPDAGRFVLVVGLAPKFQVVGWTLGKLGKRPEFWRTDTGRPAFFVPPSALQRFPEAMAA